jgi:hypothetical protein
LPKLEAMIDPEQRELTQVHPLVCVECSREWTDPRERWRIYVTSDEPPEPVVYCAGCASYEFDP